MILPNSIFSTLYPSYIKQVHLLLSSLTFTWNETRKSFSMVSEWEQIPSQLFQFLSSTNPHTFTWYIFKILYSLEITLFTFVSKFRWEAFLIMMYDVADPPVQLCGILVSQIFIPIFLVSTAVVFIILRNAVKPNKTVASILHVETRVANFHPSILSLHSCSTYYRMQHSETDESLCLNSPCWTLCHTCLPDFYPNILSLQNCGAYNHMQRIKTVERRCHNSDCWISCRTCRVVLFQSVSVVSKAVVRTIICNALKPRKGDVWIPPLGSCVLLVFQ